MSLTSRLKDPKVRRAIDPLVPKTVGRLDVATLVPPHSKRYGLIGTAFDYALRFEIRRQADTVDARSWVAETAAHLLSPTTQEGLPPHVALELGDTAMEALETVDAARDFVDNRYVDLTNPSASDLEQLAEHAVLLARLDEVYRSGQMANHEGPVPEEDITEITGLLEHASVDEILELSDGSIRLNPTFGEFSMGVGGADADIILGSTLLEIKTTKNPSVGKRELRQLIGYKLLSDEHAENSGNGQRITRIGIYFARQGHLWEQAVEIDPSSDAYGHALNVLLAGPK